MLVFQIVNKMSISNLCVYAYRFCTLDTHSYTRVLQNKVRCTGHKEFVIELIQCSLKISATIHFPRGSSDDAGGSWFYQIGVYAFVTWGCLDVYLINSSHIVSRLMCLKIFPTYSLIIIWWLFVMLLNFLRYGSKIVEQNGERRCVRLG